MLNGEGGYGDGYSGTPVLPFFKNFYAGGASSVRGFESFTIGPKDSAGNPRGGSQKFVGNVELYFPFPGLENDRSVRLGTFLDTGYVGDKFESDDVRASTGVSLLWISPLGPLKISAAHPFRYKSDDRRETFQFTIGGVF